MTGNVCLRCGLPATRSYTLYDRKKSSLTEILICESCFASYTPALKKGELVWKRSRWVTFYPPLLFVVGSKGLADAVSRLLDRLVRNRLLELLIRSAPYVLITLSAITTGTIVYNALWQMTNAEVIAKARAFYRQYPLAGIGIVGLDPVFPVVEMLIALCLAMTFHELAHAFVLRMYRYDIKRVGLILLGPVPVGAFVDPAGSVEYKMSPRQTLQLAGAGITANVLMAGIGLAGYLWLLMGLIPQNQEAIALLLRAWDNPAYLFIPPLLLALFAIPTPTTAPEGWFYHAWLGASYAFPMSVLHHIFLLNAYLALGNSLPIKPLDGGYIVPALMRNRTGYYLSILLALILLIFALIPVLLQRL